VVAPGRHRLEVTADGFLPFAQDLELTFAEARELVVVLAPATALTPEERTRLFGQLVERSRLEQAIEERGGPKPAPVVVELMSTFDTTGHHQVTIVTPPQGPSFDGCVARLAATWTMPPASATSVVQASLPLSVP
jgi:hypothetical protein